MVYIDGTKYLGGKNEELLDMRTGKKRYEINLKHLSNGVKFID